MITFTAYPRHKHLILKDEFDSHKASVMAVDTALCSKNCEYLRNSMSKPTCALCQDSVVFRDDSFIRCARCSSAQVIRSSETYLSSDWSSDDYGKTVKLYDIDCEEPLHDPSQKKSPGNTAHKWVVKCSKCKKELASVLFPPDIAVITKEHVNQEPCECWTPVYRIKVTIVTGSGVFEAMKKDINWDYTHPGVTLYSVKRKQYVRDLINKSSKNLVIVSQDLETIDTILEMDDVDVEVLCCSEDGSRQSIDREMAYLMRHDTCVDIRWC